MLIIHCFISLTHIAKPVHIIRNNCKRLKKTTTTVSGNCLRLFVTVKTVLQFLEIHLQREILYIPLKLLITKMHTEYKTYG